MKMLRKVVILAVMLGTMIFLITGCGGNEKNQTEETISRQEYLELKEQMDRMEEMLQEMEKRAQEEEAQRKSQQQSQSSKEETTTDKTNTPKKTADSLQVVLIENEYNQKERKPKVFASSYEAMSDDGTKLNQAGKVTVMLYGDVQMVEYTNSNSDFVTYEQISITKSSDYSSFVYICEKNVKSIFRVTMEDGTQLFLTVKK